MRKATAFPDTTTARTNGFQIQSPPPARQAPQRPFCRPTSKEARNQFTRPAVRRRTTAIPINRPQSHRFTIPAPLLSKLKATAFPDTTTARTNGFQIQSPPPARQAPKALYSPTSKEARNQFTRPAVRRRTTAIPISRPQSHRFTIPIPLPSMLEVKTIADTSTSIADSFPTQKQ